MSAFALTGLHVDAIEGDRFEDALEFFAQGKTLQFEDTVFVLDPEKDQLHVMKITSHGSENADAASAEISRAMRVYDYVYDGSRRFAEITAEFVPRFSVVHDYGTGSVEICHLHNGILVWKT